MRDARGLVEVELADGTVTLCGSHDLMHRRAGRKAQTVAQLRTAFAERRTATRRAEGGVDELAESLASAFTLDRRVSERRA